MSMLVVPITSVWYYTITAANILLTANGDVKVSFYYQPSVLRQLCYVENWNPSRFTCY